MTALIDHPPFGGPLHQKVEKPREDNDFPENRRCYFGNAIGFAKPIAMGESGIRENTALPRHEMTRRREVKWTVL